MQKVPDEKLHALALLPGARELFETLAETSDTYLVGGAVRDLLLGFVQLDFDIAVDGDQEELAKLLVKKLGGDYKLHSRFGTATVRTDSGLVVDVARTRNETYSQPGALPEVGPAGIEEDLKRRDFSVNAMAMSTSRATFGDLTYADDASADLAAHVLRVMHEDSFIDDPTRLLRLVRYGARLGFTAEPHTEDLARAAASGGALATVSGKRIADELLDLLGERSAVVAIDALAALELDRAIHPKFVADEYLASRVLMRNDEGLRQDLLLLATCCFQMSSAELAEFVDRLALPNADRAIVIDVVTNAEAVARAVSESDKPSAIASTMRGHCAELAAVAGALPGTAPAVRESFWQWLDMRTREHLLIDGGDLRRAGISEGPALGRALASALHGALDGELQDRESQLQHAIAVAQEDRHPQ
ncbi:MAG: CCA tRNA nucleotidyltransferase [Thermoleophilaceae bacterium]|nr:CCA tRNA nucleotidyltransferase [Thermoleophilaceae bacterium]